MDQNEEHERHDRELQGYRQSDENNHRVTCQVPDNGHQAAEECDCDEQWRMRQAHCNKEDPGQCGIDQRDRDLCPHDGSEAAVEIAEAR